MAGTVNAPTATQLQPYVFFYGRCEEALKFYKDVFHGTYEIMRLKDSPMAKEMPALSGERVMHASFTAPSISFLASDGQDTKAIDPDAGNVALALNVSEGAEAERIFTALSQGGEVKMPLEAASWGGRFGLIHDRFGNEWMISTS
jgi:PhnB protein